MTHNLDILHDVILVTWDSASWASRVRREWLEGVVRVIKGRCFNVRRCDEETSIPREVGDGPGRGASERAAVDEVGHGRRDGDALKRMALGLTYKDEIDQMDKLKVMGGRTVCVSPGRT